MTHLISNHLRSLRTGCAALLALAVVAAQTAHAADTSCKIVAKAGDTALANSRIHQALYMPAKDAKRPVTADQLGHFIVIDKTKYTSIFKGLFDAEPITTASERSQGVYYALILADMDSDCRALGKTTLAGRAALMFENGSNKKSEDALFKVWVDSATGLPLRADIDEAEVVSTATKDKNGLPVFSAKKGDKRQVNSVVFLFGDAVKAPVFGPKKGLLATPATLDAQATAAMLAMLN
jgi:hypothetical protein